MRNNFWKDMALFFLAFTAIFLVGLWAGQCRGDEVHASPQSSSTWKAATPPRAAEPFSTDPTDGPNPPEVKDPDGPIAPTGPTTPEPNPKVDPAPAPNPTPRVPGKSRTTTTTTSETEGGLIISGNSGVIYLNSPGAPQQAPAPTPVAVPTAYPLIPGPLTDQQYVGLAKRIGGGLYYAVTGNCPNKPAPAASPQMYAMVPTQGVQAVPVQMVQQAPAAQPVAAPMYVMPAQSPVYAAPQYAVVPEAPKKSWCPWKK